MKESKLYWMTKKYSIAVIVVYYRNTHIPLKELARLQEWHSILIYHISHSLLPENSATAAALSPSCPNAATLPPTKFQHWTVTAKRPKMWQLKLEVHLHILCIVVNSLTPCMFLMLLHFIPLKLHNSHSAMRYTLYVSCIECIIHCMYHTLYSCRQFTTEHPACGPPCPNAAMNHDYSLWCATQFAYSITILQLVSLLLCNILFNGTI